MANNYNFKINTTPLDKAAIEKHKDFDALLKKMEAGDSSVSQPLKVASFSKLYYWIGGMAATLLIGMLAFRTLLMPNENGYTETLAYLESQPYVQPPLKNLVQKPMILSVNADEGGTYELPSGSKLVIPKAAFANSYGAKIEGEVAIQYKEYHDFVDFFLSGIPMEIKVNGQDQFLESAGMIEVYATQNGERLQMMPDKSIEVELKSELAFAGETPPDFNIYYLDQEKRAWDLEGKDKIEVEEIVSNNFFPSFVWINDSLGNRIGGVSYPILDNAFGDTFSLFYRGIPADTVFGLVKVIGDPSDPNFTGEVTYDTSYVESPRTLAKQLDEKQKEELKQLENKFPKPKKPLKPERYDGKHMTMELDFQTDDQGAELYAGTIWEVLTPLDAFDDLATTIWENYDLKSLSNQAYQLHLKTGTKQRTLQVKPVLVGQDYDRAVQTFETQLLAYQKEKAERDAKIAAKKQEIAERIALEKEMEAKSFAEKMVALKAKGHDNYANDQIMQRMVKNRFRINRFGIWNCDRPRPPYLAALDGIFLDQDYNRYTQNVVYQTDKSQNTVRRFYIDKKAKNVQFNTNSENLLWILTEENKLAVFYPDYFNRIEKTDGEYAFEMDLNAQVINSEADVRRILKL